jgi:hypothetical protein
VAKKKVEETRWADFRDESRDSYGCEVQRHGSIDLDGMMLGAALRIADALERAYPEPDDVTRRQLERECRGRAWLVYLAARGIPTDSGDVLGIDYSDVDDENLSLSLMGPESSREEGEYPDDRSDIEVLLESEPWELRHIGLSEAQVNEVRVRLARHGLYLKGEWPE